MQNRFYSLYSLPLILAVGGCANIVPSFDIPNDPNSGTPTVRTITDEIRCELYDMILDKSADFYTFLVKQQFVAVVQLTLTVNDAGGLAPSFTYMNGPFSFNAGATLSQSREQNYTQTLYYSMEQVYEDAREYTQSHGPVACHQNIDTNLSGDLGLRQAVSIAMQSPDLETTKKISGTDGEFGGYVNFLLTKNLNAVGPTWALKHFKGPGNLASVSEVNTDKLVFAFAQQQPAAATDKKMAKAAAFTKAKNQVADIYFNQLATELSVLNSAVR